MITSHITHGRAIIKHKPFQKSLPYIEEVMFLFIMDQCCKEDMVLEVSSEVLLEVSMMPSLKEIGKSALTTGLEVLQDVAKGENIKTAAKKRLKENSPAFLDETVSRMLPRKSIKGSTNKQIAISSSKPKKRKHQSGELDDTIFSKSKKERN